MSAKDAEEMSRCASCGIGGGDEIKLKRCTACYLVKYCSVKCQKDHRSKHKKECKKRAAELRDEILFKQPQSSFGDCPICCLPLSNDPRKSTMMSCCSKSICNGCDYANKKREAEGRLQHKCLFCRKAIPETDEEALKQWMKRVEANDPVAIRYIGTERYNEEDYRSAFDYWTKAAAVGDVSAHYQLSTLYDNGEGVEKDEKKELHHLTEAAIGGNPYAHYNLAILEGRSGRVDRAVKHFIIAAKLGDDGSLERLKKGYEAGHVSKDDFTGALRGHEAAIAATRSPQREEAAEYVKWMEECERTGT